MSRRMIWNFELVTFNRVAIARDTVASICKPETRFV